MTLNSVDWDTPIMIAKNGLIVCPRIGEFIDEKMAMSPDEIQEFPNNQLYMELKDGNDWQAISRTKKYSSSSRFKSLEMNFLHSVNRFACFVHFIKNSNRDFCQKRMFFILRRGGMGLR
jgi:hypothetical protein